MPTDDKSSSGILKGSQNDMLSQVAQSTNLARVDFLDRSEAHRADLKGAVYVHLENECLPPVEGAVINDIKVRELTHDGTQWIPSDMVEPATPVSIVPGLFGVGRKGQDAFLRSLGQRDSVNTTPTTRKKLTSRDKAKKKAQKLARKRNRK